MAPTKGKEPEKPEKEAAEEPEDEPIVKELKELDDRYLALEREFEAEERALRAKFKQRQEPLLTQRAEALADATAEGAEDAEKSGTPALKGFWCQALDNHPAIKEGDTLQDWDLPVLEYLKDIKQVMLDDEQSSSFRLDFIFAENPHFEETVVSKTYIVREANPYNGETEVKQIKSTKITWKPGQDVTVAVVKKKVKGGGAKKSKQGNKEKSEPRNSFFRTFLGANLTEGEEVPEGLEILAEEIRKHVGEEEQMQMDEESTLGFMMERDYELGSCIANNVIPYAIRWYTGEACLDEDEDTDDEDDEEEDEDDEDDDDDEEEKPKAKAKPKSKGTKPTADGKDKEDCKQQ